MTSTVGLLGRSAAAGSTGRGGGGGARPRQLRHGGGGRVQDALDHQKMGAQPVPGRHTQSAASLFKAADAFEGVLGGGETDVVSSSSAGSELET